MKLQQKLGIVYKKLNNMIVSQSKTNSVQSIMVISITCLSIFISLFTQLGNGINMWGTELKGQMKIYVYFEDSLTYEMVKTQLPALKKINGIDTKLMKFVSKSVIASDFVRSQHENFNELLGDENPFKNMIILNIDDNAKDNNSLQKITKQIELIPGVYEATYPVNYVDLISNKMNKISTIILFLIVLLSVLIYVQISNSIRLHIYANRTLIKSMQLLGSTNGFIIKPYLVKSITQSIIGSLAGLTLFNLLFYYLSIDLPELNNFVFTQSNQMIVIGSSLSFCVFFNLLSTYLVLKKYMNIHTNNLF